MPEPPDAFRSGSPAAVSSGLMAAVDRELREWLRTLAAAPQRAAAAPGSRRRTSALSEAGASLIERIASDGTLKAALTEMAAEEPYLSG